MLGDQVERSFTPACILQSFALWRFASLYQFAEWFATSTRSTPFTTKIYPNNQTNTNRSRQLSLKQNHSSGSIASDDRSHLICTMPTSILKTTQPTPDQMEAGSSEPLLQRNEATIDDQQVNPDHRRRFWVSLVIALGLAGFLILVLGLGGKRLTKERFRWPGGPA